MNLFGFSNNLETKLDTKLYKVPGTNRSITWADALEGTLITGATGSGKSSGPGKHIAKAMLKSGFGGCVLCVKPDEKDTWVQYAKETNREKDLVIFNPASGLQFNFLTYEIERSGDGSGDILNMVSGLMSLNEQARVYQSGGGGNNEERFWDNSLRRLISAAITTLRLAQEPVAIRNMHRLITNCLSEAELETYAGMEHVISTSQDIDPMKREQAKADLNAWIQNNYFLNVISRIRPTGNEAELALDYWKKQFPKISDKTRGIIVESFMGIIDPFLNAGILKSQFSDGLSPELLPEKIVEEHKIVIIDFPIKDYKLSGVFAATIYKSIFQEAMERRRIKQEKDPKPVFLWLDEYQALCNPNTDSLFQVTARSSWVATVVITQNINNLFYVMGNNQPEARAKGLLGNLNLKFFASNHDIETNKWASEMIGQHLTDLESLSISKDMELSKTKNQRLQYRVMPDHFTTLKIGRKANNYKVETVVFKSGKTWADGKNFGVGVFDQNN